VRNYGGTERYALKPLELLLPPASHRWDALAFFGHRYERWSEWRGGEAFAPYLGIVGIVALAWLAFVALRALLQRRRLPGAALPAGWVLAFASIGGVTNIFAFFTGLLVFRATNRFSIFLSALALLFFASRVARLVRRWPLWLSGAAAALVATVGLLDQLPRAPGLESQRRIAARVASDRELGRRLEARLPPGAMVFQMPVMMFPEIAPPHQLGDYDYFRPYLVTRSLRFSYGMLKGRSRGRWQRDAEELPTAEFVHRLERYGFAALYFNRRGYADGGRKLLDDLRTLGRTCMFEGPLREQVVVLLEPAPQPEAPVARTLTFGEGWQNAQPGEPRWAYGPAALSYYNPYARPLRTTVRLVVSGVGERHLLIRLNDGPSTEHRIASDRCEIDLRVTLRPGVNRVDVETREPAVRLSEDRGQLRSFAVHGAMVEVGALELPRMASNE
jgi:phosphoglycerol transferase